MKFAVINTITLEVQREYEALPSHFEVRVNGRTKRVVAPTTVGDTYNDWMLVEVVEVNAQRPGKYCNLIDKVSALDGSRLTITHNWEAWTQQQIDQHESDSLDRSIDKDANKVTGKALFALANSVRALEGKQAINAQQFKAWLKGL